MFNSWELASPIILFLPKNEQSSKKTTAQTKDCRWKWVEPAYKRSLDFEQAQDLSAM